MLENKDRGNYDVYFDYANAGSASMIYVNRTWRGDPEIEALLNAADFRRAVSLGIDREQYNEAWMLGLAVPGAPVVADHHPMNPGPGVPHPVAHLRSRSGQRAAGRAGADRARLGRVPADPGRQPP